MEPKNNAIAFAVSAVMLAPTFITDAEAAGATRPPIARASSTAADSLADTSCARSNDDRRWDELFASMTQEEYDRLEALFGESGDEDLPLDFTGR